MFVDMYIDRTKLNKWYINGSEMTSLLIGQAYQFLPDVGYTKWEGNCIQE